MKILFTLLIVLLVQGCATTYSNQQLEGNLFPSISGTSLNEKTVSIPEAFKGKPTLLLIGYKQASQFDIDRWLIGLDMTETMIDVYELPTIQGLFPRMFSPFIDEGMRKGIPKELWKGVVTIYGDGELVQRFTGNTNPNNTRVILLDAEGKIEYFYDRGFSVSALNALRSRVN